MANELRVRQGFISGVIDDNPLLVGATTLTATELASLVAINSTKHAAITLDPLATAGAPEIVYVTAHTVSATTATIVRGQEGTTAREHAQNVPWEHAPTVRDFSDGQMDRGKRTTGTLTLNSTTYANVDTGLDLVLDAAVGDIVEVAVNAVWGAEAVQIELDVVSLVGGSPVNSWNLDGTPSDSAGGAPGWLGVNGALTPLSGSITKVVVAGDLSAGLLTIRWRYKTGSAANKTLIATANNPLHVWAINHGPQYTT